MIRLKLNFKALSPATYKEFRSMESWLGVAGVEYRFEWIDTGKYLPDYVWIKDSEYATAFKLQFII